MVVDIQQTVVLDCYI